MMRAKGPWTLDEFVWVAKGISRLFRNRPRRTAFLGRVEGWGSPCEDAVLVDFLCRTVWVLGASVMQEKRCQGSVAPDPRVNPSAYGSPM